VATTFQALEEIQQKYTHKKYSRKPDEQTPFPHGDYSLVG
jgi:hypothetical protein